MITELAHLNLRPWWHSCLLPPIQVLKDEMSINSNITWSGLTFISLKCGFTVWRYFWVAAFRATELCRSDCWHHYSCERFAIITNSLATFVLPLDLWLNFCYFKQFAYFFTLIIKFCQLFELFERLKVGSIRHLNVLNLIYTRKYFSWIKLIWGFGYMLFDPKYWLLSKNW